MSCLRPDLMDLYLEGELDKDGRRNFEAHLDSCPPCREALENRRLFERAISSLPPLEVPPGFAAAVMARLPAERRHAFGRLAALLTGSSVLLAALLGYHAITGEGLVEILVSAGRSVAGLAGLVISLAAKVFGMLSVLLDVAADLGQVLWKGLAVLAAVLRPEILSIAALLGFSLFVLVFLGLRKITSLGERP